MNSIILSSEGQLITLDVELIPEGTFFHTLQKNLGSKGEYILGDIPYSILIAYKEFLEFGTDFEWDEAIEGWFDFFGHVNKLGYPNNFWKIKLIDDRIRWDRQ
jgi:hypothetical protein